MTGPAAIVVAGLLLASPADPSSQEDLEAVARRVLDHEVPLSRIWPGFWPPGQPFIIHHPDTGAVFAGQASPAGPRFRPGPLPGAHSGYELDYPSGVPNTVALRYGEDVADLSTLFHEQFHDYQRDAFRWIGGGHEEFVDVSLIPDRAGFAAAAEIERRVLAEALTARRPAERRRLARQYLTLRQHRLEALPPEVAAAEAHREWSEGTAEYVGLQGAAVLAGRPDHVRTRIVEGLRRDLNGASGGFSINWFRWRAYSVGAGLAWLLDDVGAGWRGAAEQGARLDVLLAEALGETSADEDAADLLAQRRFASLRRDMAESLARAPAAPSSRDQFLASAPMRLAIHIAVPPALLPDMEMSFQAKGMTPLADDVLALTDVGYLVVRVGETELRITGRPVLTEMAGSDARQTVLLRTFDGLDGLIEAAQSNGEPVRLNLDLDWIRLRANAATVELLDDEIRLHLAP